MGLDLGEKTIGIAMSDELGLTAQPFKTMKRKGGKQDLLALGELIEQFGVSHVVVGLPKNMNNTLGPQARKVNTFVQQLQALGITVVSWDERLTTVAAERVLIQADLSRNKRKKHIDKLAATLILQCYLDSRDAASEQS